MSLSPTHDDTEIEESVMVNVYYELRHVCLHGKWRHFGEALEFPSGNKQFSSLQEMNLYIPSRKLTIFSVYSHFTA